MWWASSTDSRNSSRLGAPASAMKCRSDHSQPLNRIVGFEELPGGDEFSTASLELGLIQSGGSRQRRAFVREEGLLTGSDHFPSQVSLIQIQGRGYRSPRPMHREKARGDEGSEEVPLGGRGARKRIDSASVPVNTQFIMSLFPNPLKARSGAKGKKRGQARRRRASRKRGSACACRRANDAMTISGVRRIERPNCNLSQSCELIAVWQVECERKVRRSAQWGVGLLAIHLAEQPAIFL